MNFRIRIAREVWAEWRQSRDRFPLWHWDFRLRMRYSAYHYAQLRGWPIPFSRPRVFLGRVRGM